MNKVIETIRKYNLIEDNDKIILGVSGGSDSICMFDILKNIKEKNIIHFDMVIVTCDHNTRDGESTNDASFVKSYCESFGYKVLTYNFNLSKEADRLKMTEEEAGRKLRYEAFRDALIKENANKIATAHNLDDNAETILLNIFRGTGLNGLCGIPKKVKLNDVTIIRPLLDLSKDEIRNYCEENNLTYKEDKTNKEDNYTRNKIRNHIIPYVKENINENFLSNIKSMTDVLELEKDYIDNITQKEFNDISKEIFDVDETSNTYDALKLDLDKFNKLDDAIKKRVLKLAITKVNDMSFKDLSNTHINLCMDTIKKGTGKQITILNNITLKVSYNDIVIYKDPSVNNSDINNNDNNELITLNNNYSLIISNEYNNDTKENSLVIYDASKNKNALVPVDNKTREVSIEYKTKNIKVRQLDNNETSDMINKLTSDDKFVRDNFIDTLKELQKEKIYLDLDNLKKKTNYISNEKIETKIIYQIRSRIDGDKILIDHLNHYKLISDIFTDEKIDKDKRNKYIILEKIEKDINKDEIISSEIVALLGLRMNPKYILNNNTKSIIEVSF